jgi:ankyrin repeat protein
MFGMTALMKFAAWDKCDLIEMILPRLSKSDVNIVAPQTKFSALHHAADMGAQRAFKRLLAEPMMDAALRDVSGRTGLEIALANGFEDT